MQKITVLLADDHTVVRRGLRSLLQTESDIEVVGEAETGRQAVQLATTLKPDVVLMDITMPMMNGFDATRRIKHEFPLTLVLVVSQYDSAPFMREAIAAGASGYVAKDNASAELIPALRKTVSEHMPK